MVKSQYILALYERTCCSIAQARTRLFKIPRFIYRGSECDYYRKNKVKITMKSKYFSNYYGRNLHGTVRPKITVKRNIKANIGYAHTAFVSVWRLLE